ncbi:hypothetical protein [Halorussus sp. MSC15.2]|uniref:hypothetical protein n=1 Tax=Halorussus sp. MSC15.2 TaxID=2283638 RepID=UPI0013D1DF6D|nr:hypothetical protein [Halorussus sp. MSC15.2]NEU55369.1 hypothetical protein [Halorussus sp. MSC15.2]
MANPSLVPYSIKLRKKGETNQFLDLHNLTSVSGWPSTGGTKSLENFVEFLGDNLRLWHRQTFVNEEAERTLTVSDYAVSPSKGFAEGVLRYGKFGIESNHFSLEERTRIDVVRDSETAVESPFYFYTQITEDNPKRGIMFLERRGGRGVKTLVQDALWNALPDNLILEINPVRGTPDNPHYMSHFIEGIEANRDSKDEMSPGRGGPNTYFESLYEGTVSPYKYSGFRRQQLVWKAVLLLSAAVTDTGELSAELNEEQKIIIRTAIAIIVGATVGATVSYDAGIAIGVGAWSTSFLEGLYQNKRGD